MVDPANVLKEGWYYEATYFRDDEGGATMLWRHYRLRRTPREKVMLDVKTGGEDFASEDEMLAWIEEHDAGEIPEEAWGDRSYVPPEFQAAREEAVAAA